MNLMANYEWLRFKGFNVMGVNELIKCRKNTDLNIIMGMKWKIEKNGSELLFNIMLVMDEKDELLWVSVLYKDGKILSCHHDKEFDSIQDWFNSEIGGIVK